MSQKKGSQLFDFIAPVYGLFYERQKKYFKLIIERAAIEFKLTDYETVIDIGCGTGALCSVLNTKGLSVTGIDPASKMLKIAQNKPENTAIKFIKGNPLEGLPFEHKAFDIAITSYVAHGLMPLERKAMYAEMSRLAKHWVIVYDYNDKRSITTDFIEWLEGGDYFNFIKSAHTEMKNCMHEMQNCFSEVHVLQVDEKAAWYLCKPKQDTLI